MYSDVAAVLRSLQPRVERSYVAYVKANSYAVDSEQFYKVLANIVTRLRNREEQGDISQMSDSELDQIIAASVEDGIYGRQAEGITPHGGTEEGDAE